MTALDTLRVHLHAAPLHSFDLGAPSSACQAGSDQPHEDRLDVYHETRLVTSMSIILDGVRKGYA